MATDSPTLTRPGLWPREFPRHTESKAEKKVYTALKTSVPKGWYAWHSLRLRTREKGKFSEADFIIADPNRPGIFILEVKGGQIEQRDGQWYQNSHPLKSSPLDQAFSFRKKLIRRFEEESTKAPTIEVAVCFPDTTFDQQPAQDDLKGLVIGAQDLPYLNKILPDVMAHAVPEPWPVKGPWIRLLIKGSAGTGKTLLAREAALREARQGKRVLFLCYTEVAQHHAKTANQGTDHKM